MTHYYYTGRLPQVRIQIGQGKFRQSGTIQGMMEKKGKFDYILLETTGLADPGPIASMFWLDEGLGSEIYLDGIKLLIVYLLITVTRELSAWMRVSGHCCLLMELLNKGLLHCIYMYM